MASLAEFDIDCSDVIAIGIGPEISQSIKDIYSAAKVWSAYPSLRSTLYIQQVPIDWEEVSVTPVLKGGKTVIPDAAIQSVKKNTVALKGDSSSFQSPMLSL